MFRSIIAVVILSLTPYAIGLSIFSKLDSSSKVTLMHPTNTHGVSEIEDATPSKEYRPALIEIDSVGISLPIEKGFYNYEKEEWTLEDGFAFWANISDLPSESPGNTLLYSHNIFNGFYRLKNLTLGDEIVIYTETGEKLHYEFFRSEIVEPRDETVFSDKGEPILTLLTCEGILSQKRKIYVAAFVEISH